LPLDRAGDLDVPVRQIGDDRRDFPVARPHRGRLGEELELRAGFQLSITLGSLVQKLLAPAVEGPLQLLDEGERLSGEHLLRSGSGQLDGHGLHKPSLNGSQVQRAQGVRSTVHDLAPCAPITSACSMSAVFEGPERNIEKPRAGSWIRSYAWWR